MKDADTTAVASGRTDADSTGGCGEHQTSGTIDHPESLRAFYEDQGFVLIRDVVPKWLCEAAIQAFLSEVKTDRSFFVRHESGRFERHVFTEAGHMKYPIMNIQDISDRRFPRFRRLGLDLLTQPGIQRAVIAVLGEPGRLIHTMFFDGNQKTWAHRDARYIDNAMQGGGMVGVWVAAEDIHLNAGRFFVCPGSHRVAVPGEQDGECADPNGAPYKALMADFVANGPLACVAPDMRQGDILLWSSLTIHGSLATTDAQFSRRSFTAHFVPASQAFVQLDGRPGPSDRIAVNGVSVTRYGDQHSFGRQLKCILRANYPGPARAAKRLRAFARLRA